MIFLAVKPAGGNVPVPAMRAAILKSVFGSLLLIAVTQFAGCVNDPEDKDFYYRGWSRPRMTTEDRDYFYRDKTRQSGPPEAARLPSGEVQ
jgi:hypothetical protein